MYYRILYNYRSQEIAKKFTSVDDLIDYLNELRKNGKVDSESLYITTII